MWNVFFKDFQEQSTLIIPNNILNIMAGNIYSIIFQVVFYELTLINFDSRRQTHFKVFLYFIWDDRFLGQK